MEQLTTEIQEQRAETQRLPGTESTVSVSVVIPCLNEERFIGQVLTNLAAQWPAGAYEIIVVDGMSSDATRAVIADFQQAHPEIDVRVVDNPARHIPTALNLGIAAARGQVIVRMDAHSVPSVNYVRRCVELLHEAAAGVVGMPWRIQPGAATLTAHAIALAVAHPFGIGDAKYRLPDGLSKVQVVDTVPFGAFRKSLWQQLGGFNEALLANEDYDFNYRVRQQGERVLLDASAHSAYFARPTLGELARQYARYGRWKAQMVRLHPRSLKLRQLAAPLFVIALVGLPLVGWWWSPALWLLALMALAYTALAVLSSAQLARKGGDARLALILPFVFLLLHCAWGGSFLWGLARAPRR